MDTIDFPVAMRAFWMFPICGVTPEPGPQTEDMYRGLTTDHRFSLALLVIRLKTDYTLKGKNKNMQMN